MGDHTADDLTRSYDCKTPGCPNEATSPVGRYAYCGDCRERKASLSTAERPKAKAGELEATVKRLHAAAKNADKLAAHARKLTEQALAAKANADQAAEQVRELARSLAQ